MEFNVALPRCMDSSPWRLVRAKYSTAALEIRNRRVGWRVEYPDVGGDRHWSECGHRNTTEHSSDTSTNQSPGIWQSSRSS